MIISKQHFFISLYALIGVAFLSMTYPVKGLFSQKTFSLTIGQTTVMLAQGDIIEQPVTVIVNAAQESLLGGGGIDGFLHEKAGNGLYNECYQLPLIDGKRCAIGDAKITSAHKLTSKGITHIIHTVGPTGKNKNKEQLLRNSYTNSLALAHQHGHTTIAFPAISAGLYYYDVHESAPIAFDAIKQYINQHPNAFTEIRLVVRPQDKSTLTKHPFFDEYQAVMTGKKLSPIVPSDKSDKNDSGSTSFFTKKRFLTVASLVLGYFCLLKIIQLFKQHDESQKN